MKDILRKVLHDALENGGFGELQVISQILLVKLRIFEQFGLANNFLYDNLCIYHVYDQTKLQMNKD